MATPVAAVVLAAGLSRRMGNRNKLVLEIEGAPMVRRVVETAAATRLDPIVVVVGSGGADVRQALAGLPVEFAVNVDPTSGLSSSLRTGLEALAGLAPDAPGALVLLGDMPWVEPGDIAALLDAFDAPTPEDVFVPVHGGRRGNPVLWSARYFAEMKGLHGDVGARELLERHAGAVREVPVPGPGVLRDVDTPEALL
jgi:molybdenum cofactor cytidylyltransferase